jgi:ABC-type cobalamin transport system ATPase subunit
MHGLTGGSWKRSIELATVMEKNSPAGNPQGRQWLDDLTAD